MARFCANCGKELDDKADMCLKCGVIVGKKNASSDGNEKKKGLPIWAIVLIVVGCFLVLPLMLSVLIMIIAFSVFDENSVDDIRNYIEESIIQNGTIGDTLMTDDYKINLTDVSRYNQITSNEYETEVPAEGKEYLVFFFDIENISDESRRISSYNFDGYVDGYAISSKYLLNSINDVNYLKANLAVGTKAKGYIAFEVDTTWQQFEIHFGDWYEEIVFTVVNESNSEGQDA